DYAFDAENKPGRDLALPAWPWTRRGYKKIKPGTDMAEASEWGPSLLSRLKASRPSVTSKPISIPRADGSLERGFWFVHNLFSIEQADIDPWNVVNETPEEGTQRWKGFTLSASRGLL